MATTGISRRGRISGGETLLYGASVHRTPRRYPRPRARPSNLPGPGNRSARPQSRVSGLSVLRLLAITAILACDGTTEPENRPPEVLGPIPDQIVEVDSAVTLDLAARFADPDGNTLTYTALSAAPETAAVAVAGRLLTITGVAAGETTVTATARDPEGLTATQSFAVTVPNRAPMVADGIADGEVYVDGTLTIDLAAYFADPDGDDLRYAAVSSDTTRAAVALSESTLAVKGVAVGNATVTVTARDPGGLEAAQNFAVTVPNRAPEAVGTIEDRELEVDSVAVLDVAPYFTESDGEMLEYSAASSDPARVVAAMAGSTLTMTGVAKGGVTVTVTARDPHGAEAGQVFAVAVPNRPPESVSTIGARNVHVGDEIEIDAAAHFDDPDGDPLAYAAVSTDPARVAVEVSGRGVTVSGARVGSATVTVTARDPEGLEAEQSFTVTVPNRAPEAVGTIEDREVEVDSVAVLDLAPYFADPDGETLEYLAASSNPARAVVAVSGSTLAVTGAAKGAVRVTVTARDPHGAEAAQSFAVTVPNRAPEAVGTIGVRDVHVGAEIEIDAAAHFADPDGDPLAYAAVSTDRARVVVEVSGHEVMVSGIAVGSATVTVTARDPEGAEAAQSFAVTVPNRAPEAVGTIEDREVEVDSVAVLDVASYFAEPDGETLEYSAASSNPARVTVAVSGSMLSMTGVARGGARVTVTAGDPHGAEAAQSFAVAVPNRAPGTVGTIADRTVQVHQSLPLGVDPYFSEPDGEDLTYDAVSSDPATATVSVAGGTVTIGGVRAGTATITVTATDPGGLFAAQSFRVSVEPAPAPDLVVDLPSANPDVVGPGEAFTLSAVVRNQGAAPAPSGTTLRYFSSADAVIGTDDTEVGTDAVPPLASSGTSAQSLRVTASSAIGTYYYGACAGAVTNESDTGNNCSVGVAVVVTRDNRPPRVARTISDYSLNVGDDASLDVAPYFTDPDGDALTYASRSSDAGVATVTRSGGTISVTAIARGDATITVTATDTGGLAASQSFGVRVGDFPNRAPVVTSPLPDLSAIEGWRYRAYLPAVFTDPDGDGLTWSAISTNSAVAKAELSNDSVVVNALAPGSATVTVTATDPEGLYATDRFEVEVLAVSFDLDLLITDGFSDAQRSEIERARNSWESILEGTEFGNAILPDTVSCLGLTTTSVATLDDHLVLVGIDSIDGSGGVLAHAGFCYTRISDGTPAVSATVFDEVDIDLVLSAGSLADVAFHEFAHGLGFVDYYWERHNLLEIGADPHFAGAGAVGAFNSAGGTTYTGARVPISSPDHSHWRESVFGREGMTPRISLGVGNPFSAVTLEAMADIGYVVNSSLADDYELPGGIPPDAAVDRAGEVFDLSGDVVPGPIVVIDADGRVVHVIPSPPGAVLPSFRRKEVRVDRPENDRAGIWTRSPTRPGPPPR